MTKLSASALRCYHKSRLTKHATNLNVVSVLEQRWYIVANSKEMYDILSQYLTLNKCFVISFPSAEPQIYTHANIHTCNKRGR